MLAMPASPRAPTRSGDLGKVSYDYQRRRYAQLKAPSCRRRAGRRASAPRCHLWLYNTIRPHEGLSWNRPHDVHVGLADPRYTQLSRTQILPTV